MFHHFPSVGPKQLCVLAHLGCTREAGTSYNLYGVIFHRKRKEIRDSPLYYSDVHFTLRRRFGLIVLQRRVIHTYYKTMDDSFNTHWSNIKANP